MQYRVRFPPPTFMRVHPIRILLAADIIVFNLIWLHLVCRQTAVLKTIARWLLDVSFRLHDACMGLVKKTTALADRIAPEDY